MTISGSGFIRTLTVTQQGVSPYLTVNETSLSLGSEGNSQNSFTISSNVDWTISDNQAWLTTNHTSGTGNQTVIVTAMSANPSTSSRSATITIGGSGFTRTLSVTQQGVNPYLTVNETSLNLGSEANSQNSFTISSNVSWTISDNQAWLTTNYTSGIGNQTVIVTATNANPSTSSRSATVTISGSGFTRTLSVTQQGVNPYLTVNETSLNLGSEANSQNSFTISSNVSWTISDNQAWLITDYASGTGNQTVTMTATSANPSTSSRSATVTITGSGFTRTLTVTQQGVSPYLTVNETLLNLGTEANSQNSFTISSNVSWTINDSQAWLTTNYTSGIGNQTVTVTATSANPSTSSRSATVTISGSGFTRTLTVTQQGASRYIKVVSPNGSESYKIGATLPIRWNYSADSGSRVYIDLYKGGQLYKHLKSGVDVGNDGDHDEVLNDVTAGNDYKIRVTSSSYANVYDESDDYFSIMSNSNAYVKVTSPNGGEAYKIGATLPIRWNYSTDSGSRVYIDLYKGGQLYKHLKSGVDVGNNGDHDEVLNDVTAGNDYKIKVTSTSYPSIFDESDNYFSITSGGDVIPTNGLVAHYPFNGNANDESGNGNTGIIHGATPVPDRYNTVNRAYFFDGINDYIDCGNGSSLSFSAALTLSFWIKFTTNPYSFTGGKIIIDKAYSWRFYYAPDASTEEELADQIYSNLWGWADLSTKTTNWQTDKWYHIVTTYNKASLTTYVDGVQQNTRSLSKSLLIDSYHMFIGAQSDGPGSYFNGCIDDIRIYSRALNSTEVSSLYHENGW